MSNKDYTKEWVEMMRIRKEKAQESEEEKVQVTEEEKIQEPEEKVVSEEDKEKLEEQLGLMRLESQFREIIRQDETGGNAVFLIIATLGEIVKEHAVDHPDPEAREYYRRLWGVWDKSVDVLSRAV